MIVNVKKAVFLLFLSFTVVEPMYAQPSGDGGRFGSPPASMGNGQTPSPPSPGKVSEQETDWMKKKLKLRADQIPAIEDLNFQYAVTRTQLMQQFMKSGQMPAQHDFEKMKTTIETLQVEKDAALKPLLTDKQWTVYEKKKKNLNQNSEMQRPAMGGGMMPQGDSGGGFPRQN